jgi:hypothetical protein
MGADSPAYTIKCRPNTSSTQYRYRCSFTADFASVQIDARPACPATKHQEAGIACSCVVSGDTSGDTSGDQKGGDKSSQANITKEAICRTHALGPSTTAANSHCSTTPTRAVCCCPRHTDSGSRTLSSACCSAPTDRHKHYQPLHLIINAVFNIIIIFVSL